MKKCILVLSIIAILALSCKNNNNGIDNPNGSDTLGLMMNTDNNAAENLVISTDEFKETLKPYGKWTTYGSYGEVWVPNEGKDFRPYSTHGHWVYSDAGWVWASDYSWGWAPFHYGRWYYDDGGEGWMWVPGTEWAPAWVTWGHCDGYYGWAPLAPGISIDVSIGRGWNAPRPYWNFVPEREFVRERNYGSVVTVYSDPETFGGFYGRLTIINNRPERNIYRNYNTNVIYNAGPNITEVERNNNVRINRVALRESADRREFVSRNRQMNIYSPAINQFAQQQREARRNGRNVTMNQRKNVTLQRNQLQQRQQNFFQRNNNGDRQIMQQQDNHAAFNPGNRTPLTPPAANERMNGRNFGRNNVRRQQAPVNVPQNNPAPQMRMHGNPHVQNNVPQQRQNFAPQRRQEIRQQPQMQPQVQQRQFRQEQRIQRQPQFRHEQRPPQQQQVQMQHQQMMQRHEQQRVQPQVQQVQRMAPQPQNRPQSQMHQVVPQRNAPQNHPTPQNRPQQQNRPAPQNNNHGNDNGHGHGHH